MRRPQGFAGKAGDGTAGATRGGRRGSPSTEPLPLPPRPQPPVEQPPIEQPLADAATSPFGRLTRLPSGLSTGLGRGTGAAGAAQGARAALSASAKLTGSAARAGVRAATRARKRYEREEVRRFTWRARRRRTTWLVSLGTVAVMTVAVVGAGYSPLMALRTIEVVGANRVPTDAVISALDGQVGTPLPLLDFGQVKSELSEFMLIQSYVTESRPPGTLVVRIVEREPVGALASNAGFDLVDAAGVVIESSGERPAGYPLIESDQGVESAGFRAVTAVVSALPESIRSQLDTVGAKTKDDVTLNLLGGARVVWGSAEESEYKAVVLGALMIGHPVGSVNEYDVTSPDSAVLR